MGSGMAIASEARVKLARVLASLGHNEPVQMPDISSKEKAQKYIGLDMEKLNKEKNEFKNNQLPKWLEEARAREAKMDSKKTSQH